MNALQLKPEINEIPSSERSLAGAHAGQPSYSGAALENPASAFGRRRRARATRLAPPRDDGFHLFRVY